MLKPERTGDEVIDSYRPSGIRKSRNGAPHAYDWKLTDVIDYGNEVTIFGARAVLVSPSTLKKRARGQFFNQIINGITNAARSQFMLVPRVARLFRLSLSTLWYC